MSEAASASALEDAVIADQPPVDEHDRVYLVPYRWWKEAQESQEGSEITVRGIPYTVSPAPSSYGNPMKLIGTIFSSDLVFNLRRDDDAVQYEAEDRASGRCYALIASDLWSQALKWYNASSSAICNGGNSLFAEDDTVDVYPLKLKILVARDANVMAVKITKKDNVVENYKRAFKIFSVDSESVRIWDFSGHTELIFMNEWNRMARDGQRQSDQEIPLELQVYALSESMSSRNDFKKDDRVVQQSMVTSLPYGGSLAINGNIGNMDADSRHSGSSRHLGLTGLENLGNTCFMNSAVQCLAHTPKLVEYFRGDYSKEINYHNPLGMDGEIALAFGELLRKLWSSDKTPVTPRVFKAKLARFAPQFSGFNQHDSQEFLAFLLDGLHEDLNRVKHKPYIEAKDACGRPDEEAADEYWANHLARNNSIIVDVCQGQYRSTLVCPVCKKVSVTFDPFMYLTLPLSSPSMRTMTIMVLSTDGSMLPSSFTINVPKYGKCKDLIQALGVACSLKDDEYLLVAEVFCSRIIRYLEDPADSLNLIRDGDRFAAYRLPKDSEKHSLVVFSHQRMEERMSPCWKAFGVPLISRLPASSNGSTVRNLFLKLLSPFRQSADNQEKDNGPLNELVDMDESSHVSSDDDDKEKDSGPLNGLVDMDESSHVLESEEVADTAEVGESFVSDFHLYLTDEKSQEMISKIEANESISETRSRKQLHVLVSWQEKALGQYDICLLNSLPEVYKSSIFLKRPHRMLHELLLALVGYTGDFVIDERERLESLGVGPKTSDSRFPDEPTFKLAPDLSFITPSERSVIERLISLGFYYRELDRFATKSRNLSSIKSSKNSLSQTVELPKGKTERSSIYRRAIANGVVEVLSVYRAAVLQVEQNLLSDPTPILATVTKSLNKFDLLLPPLYELIVEIEREDIRGGQLLNLLHKRCHCGVPELQACIQRLLWHGHQVMYNQLASWMVYGILQDQHGEFFIRSQDDRDVDIESTDPDVTEKFLQKSNDKASLNDWHLGFHIYLDMLPDYVNMRVAESILFAGKAVRVLRNPSPTFRMQNSFIHQPFIRGPHKSQASLGLFPPQKDFCEGINVISDELLPQSEADKIEAMLRELKESHEFHKRLFESSINSIRTVAANHLWQLVVIRADLNGHLKALKDYFLLAKGDFFQCFLEESRQLMRLPPRQSSAEADLMVPFQLASLKTIGDEDKYFSRVTLRMPSFGINVTTSQMDLPKIKANADGILGVFSQGLPSSEIVLDGWDGITLEYSIDWPLQLFFTQEILSKYRKVFQYLIRLKRTQMELEKSWAAVMHQDHTDFANHRKDRKNFPVSQKRRQRSRPMWRVREHMTFLIRNLQFYIQVDVIESQWNLLQSHVQDSHDFTELVGFHQEYLSALISQSFLDIGSVSRILDSIMKLCLQFCWNIEHYDDTPNLPELENITEEFNKKSNSLYTILRSSRLAGSQRAPFLRQFLMRLNFNSFFEATARGVLNVVRPRPVLPILPQ